MCSNQFYTQIKLFLSRDVHHWSDVNHGKVALGFNLNFQRALHSKFIQVVFNRGKQL